MTKHLNPSKNSEQEKTGSLPLGEPVFLAAGLLRRSHGLHGDVVMDVYTDFPERLIPGKTVFIGESHRPQVIRNVRVINKGLIIGFEGYPDPESTADLRNQMVFVAAAEMPALPDGEYYHHQLIGLRVVNVSGQILGSLVEILETGANDVFVIQSADGGEFLLPAVDEFILDINLERGEIKTLPPEWD